MNAEFIVTMALNAQGQAHQEQEKPPMVALEEASNWKQEPILQGHDLSPEISYQAGTQFHYQEALGQLQELGCQWLRPEVYTREQLHTVLPGASHSWIRGHCPEGGDSGGRCVFGEW